MKGLSNVLSRFSGWWQGRSFISPPFCVLGIETSCDDTGAAVIHSSGKILGQSLASDPSIFDKYGGILPPLAARKHDENIDFIVNKAIQDSGLSLDQNLQNGRKINAIAATIGPGLRSSLKVGMKKAISLSKTYGIPFIPINHLEGHALVPRLFNREEITFPFFVVLLSGGHSQFLVCKNVGDYLQIGSTLDDSLGECYDKVARALGISFSEGGAGLEQLAMKGEVTFPLSSPLSKYKNCDLSFSGMKSAIVRVVNQEIQLNGRLSDTFAANIAASFQEAALKHVQQRLERGLAWCEENIDQKLSSLVVVGGVARNKALRDMLTQLAESHSIKVFFPPMEYCVDNGVMISWVGVERLLRDPNCAIPPTSLILDSMEPKPKWPLMDPSKNERNVFGTKYRDMVEKKRQAISQHNSLTTL